MKFNKPISEFRTNIPEGEIGNVKIDRFVVSGVRAGIERIRALWNSGRYVPEGEYTRLLIDGQVMMSDTPDEIRDHLSFIYQASGKILINGLGLGIALELILQKKEVKEVTVIELNENVIKLVAPHFKDPRCTIIHDNAFDFKPPKGVRYDFVWHDIWVSLCTDNLEEMTKLKRKYGRRCNWQECWGEGFLRYQKRKEKRENSLWHY